MSLDMSEFYQVFFEEAGELLAQMEQLLLNIDVGSPDPEDLNAIFRCAHSIKGGAATFGFADLTEVTHVLESLLDRIRKGEVRLRPVLVDAFLGAGDVLKDQLAGHRGDGEADPAAAADVCARLRDLAATADAPAQPAAAPSAPVPAPPVAAAAVSPGPPVEAPVAAPAPGAQSAGGRFRIGFEIEGAPKATAGLAGHVIAGLERLGEIRFTRGGRGGGGGRNLGGPRFQSRSGRGAGKRGCGAGRGGRRDTGRGG